MKNLLFYAIKDCGSYNPRRVMPHLYDVMTRAECDWCEGFLNWVCEDEINRRFGSGNYLDRINQYNNARLKKAIAKEKEEEEKVCCLCRQTYSEWGNNAEPIKSGQCCDDCNTYKVVPERIKRMNSSNSFFPTTSKN